MDITLGQLREFLKSAEVAELPDDTPLYRREDYHDQFVPVDSVAVCDTEGGTIIQLW